MIPKPKLFIHYPCISDIHSLCHTSDIQILDFDLILERFVFVRGPARLADPLPPRKCGSTCDHLALAQALGKKKQGLWCHRFGHEKPQMKAPQFHLWEEQSCRIIVMFHSRRGWNTQNVNANATRPILSVLLDPITCKHLLHMCACSLVPLL